MTRSFINWINFHSPLHLVSTYKKLKMPCRLVSCVNLTFWSNIVWNIVTLSRKSWGKCKFNATSFTFLLFSSLSLSLSLSLSKIYKWILRFIKMLNLKWVKYYFKCVITHLTTQKNKTKYYTCFVGIKL